MLSTVNRAHGCWAGKPYRLSQSVPMLMGNSSGTTLKAGAAARLAAGGQVRAALGMIPPGLYPAFAARTLARLALPGAVRQALRGSAERDAAPIK
jgi:hypothetical protein